MRQAAAKMCLKLDLGDNSVLTPNILQSLAQSENQVIATNNISTDSVLCVAAI